MYPAARLSPYHLRRESIRAQPPAVRGMAIPCRNRKYRRGPLRKASAEPEAMSMSASSGRRWATREPSYDRTGIPSGLARLVGGADWISGRGAGGPVMGPPPLRTRSVVGGYTDPNRQRRSARGDRTDKFSAGPTASPSPASMSRTGGFASPLRE